MASPNFNNKKAKFERFFTEDRIEYIWKKKVRYDLKSQMQFDAFEYLDIHSQIQAVSRTLRENFCSGKYRPANSIRISVEKSKGLCRHISVPMASDAIVLQLLSDHLYPSLKRSAPTNSAMFEQKDFSFKKINTQNLDNSYGTFKSWLEFQRAVFDFSHRYKFIVTTDIANFYDCINHESLRNVISSRTDAHEYTIDALIYALTGLLWQPEYSAQVQVGLPQIDGDAPRILAHSFLYEADEYLDNFAGAEFTRFMDDFDIGVNSIPDAKRILRDLDVVLKARNIRLNSGKTQILTADEAYQYFWIKENARLDGIEQRIDRKKIKAGKRSLSVCLLSRRFHRKYSRGDFSYGNGEKIIKRYLTLFSKLKVRIKPKVWKDLLKNRPGCRGNVFRYLKSFPIDRNVVGFAEALLESGLWVDEASSYWFADYLVECRSSKSIAINQSIQNVLFQLENGHSPAKFSDAAWIASKFLDPSELLALCTRCRPIWESDPTCGRLVGQLQLRMKPGSQEANKFKDLVIDSSNKEAISALRYSTLLQLREGPFNSTQHALKAPNTNAPNKISHGKTLMVLNVLQNTQVSASKRHALAIVHAFGLSDIRYAKIQNQLT